jgi:hypothetical protein
MEKIRRITLEDKERVLEICKTIWEGDDYIPQVFDKWVSDPNSYFVGLFDEDNILVGFGRLASQEDGNFWLEGLRKDRTLKIKGVGKKIADYLIKIAIEKECKSLKFSTYFDNVESITLNERIGFSKIKQWSLLEVPKDKFTQYLPATSRVNDPKIALEQFIGFVRNSKFLAEMNNYLCEGWKVYDVSVRYLTDLYNNATIYSIIKEDVVQSLICNIKDQEGNIFIIFLDYKTEEHCKTLLQLTYQQAAEQNSKAVSIIVPNHARVESMMALGFESWEQHDDFLLFEYRGE